MGQTSKLILAVDDNEDILDFLEFTLESKGFVMHKTAEIPTAIDLVRKHQYCCIVLDIILANNTTSDKIVDAIVHESDHPNTETPLIIISGHISQHYADKIKRKCARIKEVLLKPFTEDEFLEAINRPMPERPVPNFEKAHSNFNVLIHGSKEIIDDEMMLVKGSGEANIVEQSTLIAGEKEGDLASSTIVSGTSEEIDSSNEEIFHGTVTRGQPTNESKLVVAREQLELAQVINKLEAGDLNKEMTDSPLAIESTSHEKKADEIITALRGDINYRNAAGETILMLLCAKGAMAAIKEVIAKNANVGLMSKFGKTCLHYATRTNNPEVIPFLLSMGAKINAKDSSLQEPMFDAVVNGNAIAVEALLKHGARITNKVKGRTYLMYAAVHGRVEVAKRLVIAGIDVKAKDINGQTALDIAIKKEHQGVIDLLSNLT
ncbi:MAG: hypothetical protein A2504_05005 [Bdellovibrionales bacterium RIFOXYD12_FULL_39_22]|nr:MAG: hypothetical protein A2385_06820 [Bdellovibrionales bacterium RIFOXYB1_FULL_39_21]OFZ41982.1 MAG: hypothetical protein A2485_08790 [Bdellovibrionales bacterium RIFOXYC12_FULL_39_17]OFZ50698.1 MAG: hypothetical protein A2404_05740 [Bdellovibrionales bacterium RIFOXYC1_FULL_39_130]OFZ76446.1 MAG: hypothetical protein A2451_09365 [Bdellovibrionales bacterium RIFOXYC2_FULL_39_8]OFZ77921.1 MAG: hypothetical protein A2560_00910 [Bdellovibrionales bacterium RIFOXYD1_FULL_39_84]OFZ93643.1 MAG: